MFKQKIYDIFLQNLTDKINAYQLNLDELKASVQNETKSTAGDKHETALAMLQMEQSQIAKHMLDAIDARKIFLQLDMKEPHEYIKSGSLVKTNHGYFLIGVALPKIITEGKIILAVSPLSPFGALLMGKHTGEEIVMNHVRHTIEEIF